MERDASTSTQTPNPDNKKDIEPIKDWYKGETYDYIIRRLFETAFYELGRTRDEEEYIPLEAL